MNRQRGTNNVAPNRMDGNFIGIKLLQTRMKGSLVLKSLGKATRRSREAVAAENGRQCGAYAGSDCGLGGPQVAMRSAAEQSSKRRTTDFKSNSDYTKPTALVVVSFYDLGVVPELT